MLMVKKLIYLRKRDRLTTEEISVRSGIPVGTLNKIFAGVTKNPASHTMMKLAGVFHVPLRYLMDDSIPLEQCSTAVVEKEEVLHLSLQESEMVRKYRRLDRCTRSSIDALLEEFVFESGQPQGAMELKHLPCYISIAEGQKGTYADVLQVKALVAPIISFIREADFAVLVGDSTLEPIYPPNTVLAVKKKAARHNQLGAFILNGEGFVRKLYDKKGLRKLVSINLDQKEIVLTPQDQLRCLGVVLGAIRTYRWCTEPPMKKTGRTEKLQ